MSSAAQSQRICGVQGVISREYVRLTRLHHIGVDGEELIGARVVVAVECRRTTSAWRAGSGPVEACRQGAQISITDGSGGPCGPWSLLAGAGEGGLPWMPLQLRSTTT